MTVTVTEVNEGPEISGRDTLTVSENYEAKYLQPIRVPTLRMLVPK